jgi:hypothetical protein
MFERYDDHSSQLTGFISRARNTEIYLGGSQIDVSNCVRNQFFSLGCRMYPEIIRRNSIVCRLYLGELIVAHFSQSMQLYSPSFRPTVLARYCYHQSNTRTNPHTHTTIVFTLPFILWQVPPTHVCFVSKWFERGGGSVQRYQGTT